MEKTLEIHLEEQAEAFTTLLAKNAVDVSNDNDWYVPAQVAMDIVNGRIKE
jgi:hypothetical protein